MVGAGEGAACAQTCNPANCSIKRAKIRTVAISLGSWVRCYMEHEVVRGRKNRALLGCGSPGDPSGAVLRARLVQRLAARYRSGRELEDAQVATSFESQG